MSEQRKFYPSDRISNGEVVLAVRRAGKRFGSVEVLKDVSLDLRSGEVHALLGENGAGKSTLIRIIGGIVRPEPGCTLELDGRQIAPGDAGEAKVVGISIVHQELNLAENLTVAENIFLGSEARLGPFVRRGRMEAEAQVILAQLGACFAASDRVGSLSLADRQLVEIGRAINLSARVIVMDEPTTSLAAEETERLTGLIRRLKAEGRAILYISHRMEEIFALADRATVLRDGRVVGRLTREAFDPDRIVELMVGRTLSGRQPVATPPPDGRPPRIAVEGIEGDGEGPVSFALQPGEVLGLAGLIGSGRTRLAERLTGLRRPSAGRLLIDGRPVNFGSPRATQQAGVAYLTEDRGKLGLFAQRSVRDNLNFLTAPRDAWLGAVLDGRRMSERAKESIRSLSIRLVSDHLPVGRLSGGNQQKVLLGRLLQIRPRILVLDEPTRGVDVGAKQQIYEIVERLAAEGVAVLVVSSDMVELIGLCPRVLVMREGRIAGEVGGAGAPVTEAAIAALAAGLGSRGAITQKTNAEPGGEHVA